MFSKRFFPILFLALTALSFFQCSKDSNPLAEHSFECKIDGIPFSRVIAIDATIEDGVLRIVAVGERNGGEGVIFYIPNFTGKGSYQLAANLEAQQNLLVYLPGPAFEPYSNFSVNPGPGSFVVTNYEGGGVLNATFSGRVNYDGDLGDYRDITDGRIENLQVVPK